jgi:hypothetical protein
MLKIKNFPILEKIENTLPNKCRFCTRFNNYLERT